ncbi:Slp family lipoprotein [Pseudomonadota bacterium]
MAYLKHPLVPLFCSLLICACATAQLTPEQAALRATTPTMAAAQPNRHQGKSVEWGGLLIATHNRQNHTLIEILAYPLRSNGRPNLGDQSLGRFLAIRAGYLEPLEFTAGRQLTVIGPITGTRQGRVGEGDYIYPTIEAGKLQLWPREAPGRTPRLRFGIGVGSGGGGFGAGIGF